MEEELSGHSNSNVIGYKCPPSKHQKETDFSREFSSGQGHDYYQSHKKRSVGPRLKEKSACEHYNNSCLDHHDNNFMHTYAASVINELMDSMVTVLAPPTLSIPDNKEDNQKAVQMDKGEGGQGTDSLTALTCRAFHEDSKPGRSNLSSQL